MLFENDVFSVNPLNRKVSSDILLGILIFKTKTVSVMQNLFPFFKMGLFKFHSREDKG
jgi:hypothetical protein